MKNSFRLLATVVMLVQFVNSNSFSQEVGWTSVSSGTSLTLRAVSAVPISNNLVAVGDSATIIWSEDTGNSWLKIPVVGSAALHGVSFPNADTGFAVGDSGTVLKLTRNGAIDLSGFVPESSRVDFHAIATTPDAQNRIAFVVGDSGVFLRTIDRGLTWTRKTLAGKRSLRGVFAQFPRVFVVGDSGTIGYSSNAGSSWTMKLVPVQYGATNFESVAFIADTGIVVGDNGVILRSTNLGGTWLPETSGTTKTLRSVFVSPYDSHFNPGETWIAGDSGVLLHAQSSGAGWTRQQPDTTANLFGIAFIDSLRGVSIGANGRILRTSTAGFYEPIFHIEETGLSFGPVVVNSSKTVRLSVTNEGTAPLNIFSVGTPGSEFSITPVPLTIPASERRDMTITFSPQTVGEKGGSFLMYYNGRRSPQNIFVSATAIDSIIPSKWSWLNPQPQGNVLYDVAFLHNDTAIAVGDVGTIMKSVDGGVNWSVQHYAGGVPNRLYSVSFVDNQTGFAAGEYGTILKTVDGGNHWMQQESSTLHALRAIAFSGPLKGCAIDIGNGYSQSSILQTTDAGQTWDVRARGYWQLGGVAFADSNIGIAVGSVIHDDLITTYTGVLLRTTDGGAHWTRQDYASPLNDIQFLDLTTAVIVGNGLILRTTDAGITWNPQTSPTNIPLSNISFADQSFGVASGWSLGPGNPPNSWSGVIVRTTDGGQSWSQAFSTTSFAIASVAVGSTHTALAIGQDNTVYPPGNTILHSTNEGMNWSEVSSSATTKNLFSASFPTSSVGTVVGVDGTVLRTVDGGTTWQNQLQGTLIEKQKIWIYGVSFPDEQNGTIVGSAGLIAHTSDGGSNWEIQSSSITDGPDAVAFRDNNHGIIVGIGGAILTTSDGGGHWINSPIGITESLSAVAYTSTGSATLVGENGRIITSTDQSLSQWIIQDGPVNRYLSAVKYSGQFGLIVGNGGTILRTTNGGSEWELLSSGTQHPLYGVAIYDTLHAVAVGFNGTVLVTRDGGNHWERQSTGTLGNLSDVVFGSSSDRILLFGANGTILQTTSGGIITAVAGSVLPQHWALLQNYPNPFNPATTIRFSIAKSSRVSLRVYDMLGREVAVLVDEEKHAGTYDVRWNASKLSSGIYFYALRSEGFSDVKKMLLVK